MQNIAIYLHGYGSNGNTDTAKGLRVLLADSCKLISPTYDWSKPHEAVVQLADLYRAHVADRPVLVGTSLGGFYANYLARVLDAPAVIVNPALYPSTSLSKYGESEETLAGYAELERQEAAQLSKPNRVVVLGLHDELLDHANNGLLLQEGAAIEWLDMGHRIDPKCYEAIGALIRRQLAQR